MVSKAWTACSSGNRWVTRGFTFTFPDDSMAMAIGQLQHNETNVLQSGSFSVTPNMGWALTKDVVLKACKYTSSIVWCRWNYNSSFKNLLIGYFLTCCSSERLLWCPPLSQQRWPKERWPSQSRDPPTPPRLLNVLPENQNKRVNKISNYT